MVIHNPESTEQEKAMALKIGGPKKIQIIDGQQVEVLTGEIDDDEETKTVVQWKIFLRSGCIR